MIARVRRHLRQHALAWVAIFIALGGTSYAAVRLSANSVGARELKAGAVRASEVRDGSLTRREFRRNSLPEGAKGDRGEPGPPGPKGDKGDPGATNVIVREGGLTPFEGTNAATGIVQCAPGERATGGGIRLEGQDDFVQTSRPVFSGETRTPVGWFGHAKTPRAGEPPQGGLVYAICSSP